MWFSLSSQDLQIQTSCYLSGAASYTLSFYRRETEAEGVTFQNQTELSRTTGPASAPACGKRGPAGAGREGGDSKRSAACLIATGSGNHRPGGLSSPGNTPSPCKRGYRRPLFSLFSAKLATRSIEAGRSGWVASVCAEQRPAESGVSTGTVLGRPTPFYPD